MKEVFKDIVGYEGKYQISNYGNVKSLARLIKKKSGSYGMSAEKIMSPSIKKDGYLVVYLRDGNERKKFSIHRLVAVAFIPNIENKPDVNHVKGNKKDNRSWKLEWVTKSENTIHAYKIGIKKSMKGIINPMAKLNDEKVISIKSSEHKSVKELSIEYGVDPELIRRIIKGKAWSHVTLKIA